MAMEGLGRAFDVTLGFKPVDMQTAANTGARVHLKNCGGVDFVLYKGAGTAGDDPVLTLQEHNAASSGTSQNLVAIDHYYLKTATTMDGSELWVKTTQTKAATITDPGGLGTSAESQMFVVVPLEASALSDGFEWVSLSVADVGGNAQLGCMFYLLRDLTVSRTPANLVQSHA